MRDSERRLRRRLAAALREQAEDVTAAWVESVARRRDLPEGEVLPTDRRLDHLPVCFRAIADALEGGDPDRHTQLIREKMSAYVQHRHGDGQDVEDLLGEYDILATRLQEWLERTVGEDAEECDPRDVTAVVGELKEAFARFGIETARASRIWAARRARDRAVQFSGFGSMLRHELRNHVGSARTAAELLLEDGVNSERRKRLTDLIVRSLDDALRAVDLVQEVMSDDGAPSRPPVWLPLRDLLQVAMSDRAPGTPRVEVNAGELPEVSVPGSHVTIVLINLLDNACRHHDTTRDDPWVRITADSALPPGGESSNGEWVRVEVSDNGPGVDANVRDRVFEFTLGEEDAPGVGLPLARDLVEQLGGSIELESEPGTGTTVSFVVPARRPAELTA